MCVHTYVTLKNLVFHVYVYLRRNDLTKQQVAGYPDLLKPFTFMPIDTYIHVWMDARMDNWMHIWNNWDVKASVCLLLMLLLAIQTTTKETRFEKFSPIRLVRLLWLKFVYVLVCQPITHPPEFCITKLPLHKLYVNISWELGDQRKWNHGRT